MNFLRLSFTAASHKTFRHKALLLSNVNTIIRGFATTAGNSESEEEQVVVKMMNPSGDFVTYNTKVEELSHADQKASYTSLIGSLCKKYRIDEAYRVLNQMIVSGFSPSYVTLNNVLRGLIRIGETRKAYEMRNQINEHEHITVYWMYDDTESSFYRALLDEINYTSLMNAYLDEGKWDNASKLYYEMKHLHKLLYQTPHCKHLLSHLHSLLYTVLDSVFINGLHKKTRTTQIKKELLKFNYMLFELDLSADTYYRPILVYRHTLAENNSEDEFKTVVKLVNDLCNGGLDYVVDMFLSKNYKPDGIDDGIVYNLFIIAHCKYVHADDAYYVYKEMVHSGFACHMFTVFALITTLKEAHMVNELRWVIQNVLRSCNLNDSEIVKFLDEVDPKKPGSDALFDVLAEKAKDGLFLKCSYAPASA